MNTTARVALALALLAASFAAHGAAPASAARSRLKENDESVAGSGKRIVRARQDSIDRASAVRTVGLVMWNVEYQTKSGEAKSDLALENMSASLEAILAARGFAVKRLARPAGGPSAEAWREVALLNEAVQLAILEATHEYRFAAKLASFEYGLGDLTPLVAEEGVDAIVLVEASGREGGSLRRVLFGGAPAVVVSLSFVERSGEILWAELIASGRSYDLLDRRRTDELLHEAFEDLRGGKP